MIVIKKFRRHSRKWTDDQEYAQNDLQWSKKLSRTIIAIITFIVIIFKYIHFIFKLIITQWNEFFRISIPWFTSWSFRVSISSLCILGNFKRCL